MSKLIKQIFLFMSWFSEQKPENIVENRLDKNIDLINELVQSQHEKYTSKWYHSTFYQNKLSSLVYRLDLILISEEEMIKLVLNIAKIIHKTMSDDPFMRPFLGEYPFLDFEVRLLNYDNPNQTNRHFARPPYISSLNLNLGLRLKKKINMWSHIADGKSNVMSKNRYFFDPKTWIVTLVPPFEEPKE